MKGFLNLFLYSEGEVNQYKILFTLNENSSIIHVNFKTIKACKFKS
jgi:hypothetical protein